MNPRERTERELLAEVDDLKARLQEAEATISGIQSGEVDALVISGDAGEELYMLRGAERPYRILVESMNEGALSVTAEGAIIYANRAFVGMAGALESGTFLGLLFRELISERDLDRFDRFWAASLEGGDVAELLLDFDGRQVPVYVSSSAQMIDDEPIIFLVTTEISERIQSEEKIKRLNEDLQREAQALERRVSERTQELKAANEELEIEVAERRFAQIALQEERERLSVTLQSIGDGVIATDVSSRVVLLNNVAQSLTGWSQKEAEGRQLREVFNIINEDTRQSADDPLQTALKQGRVSGLANHTILIARDGSERSIADSCAPIIAADGTIFGAVLVFRDVTAELDAERLRDSLNEINASINSTLVFDEIMNLVVEESCKAVGCDSVSFELKNEDYWETTYAYGLPREYIGLRIGIGEAPELEMIAKTKKPQLLSKGVNETPVSKKALESFDAAHMMIIPVIIKGEIEAALRFVRRTGFLAYTDSHLDFGRKLAASLSLSLENARLYATERNIAQTLQEALILVPERMPGLEYSHIYHSATEEAKVGGDFYNIFAIEEEKVGVLIGDVAGKGIAAATLTLQVQNTIKSFTSQGYSPAEVMRKTNTVLARTTKIHDFVTVFLCSIDVKTGHLVYCSGGHPPPLIKRKSGKIESLVASSPVIGAFPDVVFSEEEAQIAQGDLLILYTDGVIEARNASGKLLGFQGLAEVASVSISLQKMPEHIYKGMTSFSGGQVNDDVAILCISLKD